jgi:MoaA/NifB/PqqE/SkfB family radical SAM enzyme
MSKNIYCPMIHGGLNIDLKANGELSYNQCCLSTTKLNVSTDTSTIWNTQSLIDLREENNNNNWNPGCWECERLENVGARSFRQGMIEKFGITQNLSGPQRIDLLFDRSCNLACRTCGSHSSTFWEKHLRDNNLPTGIYYNKTDNLETVFNTLKSLDLSNLEMVQFCGGETLLGNTYWKAAEIIAELVPNAKNKITLGFQTNCTQPIDEKYYKTIEKFQLVKFMLSIDSTHNRFEYFRWPANWNQVVDNIMNFREKLPVNVMFFVQEVTSCLNLFYYNEVPLWLEQNFSTNRLGDPVGYARQLVMHKNLDVNNITHEYVDAIKDNSIRGVLKTNWVENPTAIKKLIDELDQFDKIRNQNWKNTFPEIAGFYSRYL